MDLFADQSGLGPFLIPAAATIVVSALSGLFAFLSARATNTARKEAAEQDRNMARDDASWARMEKSMQAQLRDIADLRQRVTVAEERADHADERADRMEGELRVALRHVDECERKLEEAGLR